MSTRHDKQTEKPQVLSDADLEAASGGAEKPKATNAPKASQPTVWDRFWKGFWGR